MADSHYSLIIQACEPETLPKVDSVEWTVLPEPDSMGLPEVEIVGTRDAILAFVLSEWGDEDPDWFASLADRMHAVPVCTGIEHEDVGFAHNRYCPVHHVGVRS